MALLTHLGLVAPQAMGRLPAKQPSTPQVANGNPVSAKASAGRKDGPLPGNDGTGKAAPTAGQVAERERIARELREAVPLVKDMAEARHEDSAEAARLARETHGLLSWETLGKAKEKLEALKALVTGKAGVPEDSPRRAPKSNAEVSLDEFNKDLGGAIGNIGKMRKAAKKMGADQLDEHLGKISEGLSAVKEKSARLVEIVELVDDLKEFQRALETARGLDLNKDYEASAIAMGDLANIGGKLAKEATGNGIPGLDAYFTLLQNAGSVWEMGARLHKKTDDMFIATGQTDGPVQADPEAKPTAVPKGSTAIIPLGRVEDFMRENMARVEEEGKWMGGTLMNDIADWELSTDAFVRAFAEFMEMHDKRHKITLGPLSAEYRHLSKEMQAPYDQAMHYLLYLQDAIGKRSDLSVTYEPALKAMKKADPSTFF